ncbi:MAG: ComF family protein [Planctomycetes bacterium]|nr:ComF family protein [Planctomycetota bacterium]
MSFVEAPLRFAGTGGVLVRRFKLDGDAAAGWLLAGAMQQAWAARDRTGWSRAYLVSVPLHPTKCRRRGFDQAAWLARRVAQRHRLRLAAGVLRRSRATLAQGDPRTISRERNVEGVFEVVRPGIVEGRRILLVDDVMTSGATLRACARALHGGGAREVAALVACRS